MPIFLLTALPLLAIAQTPHPMANTAAAAPWQQTAQLIDILPEVERLRQLTTNGASVDRWQLLWLHQHISEQSMATSLQVDATIAQIDNEIARAHEVRGYLADRRNRAVTRANLWSVIVGGGLGATSSGLQLSSGLNKPAAGVGIAAGTVSASLAIAGIHAQKGATSHFEFSSNMLAELFDRPALADSQYPATIWTFLNQRAPSGPADITRKQQLLQTWVAVKRIDSLASRDKIARLTSQPDQLLQLDIDDFEDRAAMLQDVRARISFLKRDLGDLMASLLAAPESMAPDFKGAP